jgi:hypothetical protein
MTLRDEANKPFIINETNIEGASIASAKPRHRLERGCCRAGAR